VSNTGGEPGDHMFGTDLGSAGLEEDWHAGSHKTTP
jgi:hypothetical protein